ncbi:MAG: hypothetical protein ACOYMA_00080 [Bacteroidia bacterium]
MRTKETAKKQNYNYILSLYKKSALLIDKKADLEDDEYNEDDEDDIAFGIDQNPDGFNEVGLNELNSLFTKEDIEYMKQKGIDVDDEDEEDEGNIDEALEHETNFEDEDDEDDEEDDDDEDDEDEDDEDEEDDDDEEDEEADEADEDE